MNGRLPKVILPLSPHEVMLALDLRDPDEYEQQARIRLRGRVKEIGTAAYFTESERDHGRSTRILVQAVSLISKGYRIVLTAENTYGCQPKVNAVVEAAMRVLKVSADDAAAYVRGVRRGTRGVSLAEDEIVLHDPD